MDTGEINMKELEEAIGKPRSNKAPGPDGTPPGLGKPLDSGPKKIILEQLNNCWNKETLAKDMNDAKLVIIYKKGGTDLPQNYRPIALLSVMYKLLASITQARISSKMDEVINKNQFGFRKGKSTSQPLFILRTQEIQEEAALESHLLLLDWEKAFDKVSQSRMIRAIRRLGVPEKIINMIMAIYLEPKYAITDKDATTAPRTQKTGIRQGCPLSPYLLIMLMAVIMHDVEAALIEQERNLVPPTETDFTNKSMDNFSTLTTRS